ncbi:MAG TPA: hypothetical protein VJ063_18030 [Verrucomicrobiae bacterium]|nr:hypothetical protein [Verrucomicrobiae bacterium]
MKMCFLAVAALMFVSLFHLPAGTINIPNGSFEGPDTTFADPRMDSWQDYPKPVWYDELANGPWDFLTGVFENTEPGASNHIRNIHGTQAAFMINAPAVGFFQDYNSTDWANPLPTHAFDVTFEPGKAYQLTVGFIGGGGNMPPGASVAAALYYRDASSNMVFVAMTNVVHSTVLFPTATNFVDIPLWTRVVRASDPHANQKIGIAIFSTLMDTNYLGGYWDIDNVRLRETLIDVPNGSFEGPDTTFADPRMDSWQDFPKPVWYDELANGPWDFLTGVFENTEPGASNHIDNIDGTQAAFMINAPAVGFFQDYNSTDWANPLPTHEFNATFQPGKAYQLTVGLIGGGGNMPPGASIATALYYRDASSNMVFVAMTNIVHTPTLFPDTTNFVDIPLMSGLVQASAPQANQHIGIAIFSTLMDTNYLGGYWDIDNVRLREIERPRLTTTRKGEMVVHGEPGLKFDILASANLTTPFANWAVIGTVQMVTDTATFQDPSTSKGPRFYIARSAQ